MTGPDAADMSNYLDKIYSAVDGVLLTYDGDSLLLDIPGHLAGMTIHTIGQGAFMESACLKRVVIPDTVLKIGDDAFRRCEQLSRVSIPCSVTSVGRNAFEGCPNLIGLQMRSAPMTGQQYLKLRSESNSVNGSVFLAHSFPDDERIRSAIAAAGVRPANCVPAGIKRLFTTPDTRTGKKNTSLHSYLDSFSFDGDERYATEKDAFLQMIREDELSPADAISEERNDDFMKTENYPKIERTALFTFDDNQTKNENGSFSVLADIRIGYHFWQAAVPVVYGGELYRIYRRNYLSSLPNLNYVRRDVTVFSEDEQVDDPVAVREVYAKYKLLSIL